MPALDAHRQDAQRSTTPQWPKGGGASSMEGPSKADSLFLARPFVLLTRLILAYPVATIAIALGFAVAACYLTATQLGYQTSRLDLLNPKSSYNKLWIEYIEEFGDEDDAVVVVEGAGREQVVPVLEEL